MFFEKIKFYILLCYFLSLLGTISLDHMKNGLNKVTYTLAKY